MRNYLTLNDMVMAPVDIVREQGEKAYETTKTIARYGALGALLPAAFVLAAYITYTGQAQKITSVFGGAPLD